MGGLRLPTIMRQPFWLSAAAWSWRHTSGASQPIVNILPRRLTRDSSWGGISCRPGEKIWKTWAPTKCRFFMWLVAHNRCWTAHAMVYPTRSAILCVTKHLKWSTISCWLHLCKIIPVPFPLSSGPTIDPYLLSLRMLPFMIGGRGSAVTAADCYYKESIFL
jgi:hypothetical protein